MNSCTSCRRNGWLSVLAESKEPKERYVAEVGHREADLLAVEGDRLANIVENGGDARRCQRRKSVRVTSTR